MNFSTWSIRNPAPIVLLFILLSILGVLGFKKLGIQQFPDMDLPMITISASLEGAAPEQLETEVARKIEDSLISLPLLDHISTTITDGSVSINVSFDIDKDSEVALQEVSSAVDGVQGDLPASMMAPSVSKITAETSSLITYSITSSALDEEDLSWFMDNDMAKAVLAVPGVAAVSRVGGIDREIHVDLDPALMAGLGVTASEVSSQLIAVEKDNSGGQGTIGTQQQTLRTLAAANSPQEIAAINLPLSNGRHIRLDQVAKISDSYGDRSSLAFLDGKPTMALQITRSKGFSDVGVAEQIRTAVAAFSKAHPNVHVEEISTTITPILENYEGSIHLLLEGAFLAVLVVWWFLRNWRSTIIAATALPLSILPAFAVMSWAGFSLNTISLLALALVTGILVDDAIVEIENIERHMHNGKSARAAAMEAVTEIGLAVVATTLTLVAIFLPTAFMGGIPGKIFRQFGITASVAILASLLVARLLTPMLAASFMKPSPQPQHDSSLMTRYLSWVRVCLQHPRKTAAGAALFFVLSLCLIPFISTGFFPAQDDGQSQVSISLAPGSTLAETKAVAEKVAAALQEVPEISHIFTNIGTSSSGGGISGGSSMSATNSATMKIILQPRDKRKLSQGAVEQSMRTLLHNVPGARISIGRGGNGEQLDLTLASDDPVALAEAISAVENDVRHLPNIGNVTSSAALQRPEIHIYPDNARAAAMGVTSTDLADTIRMATYGNYSSSLAKLNLPQRQLNVRVRFNPEVQKNIHVLGQIRTPGANGDIALSSIAKIGFGSGPAEVNRLDRSRNITLAIELNGQALGAAMQAVKALPSMQSLPPAVHLVEQGELQHMTELFSSFGLAMAIGVFCVFAVLVLLFHDFLQPFTILATLPLSVGGALLALLLTHNNFSMPSIIGLLMLMGVVTKNAILLVEYAIMAYHKQGLSRTEALIDACHKRARPIIMTTIAMTAGMLPIALGFGADPSFRQPMAIVVIGGLLTSTVLSLIVIPVLFALVDELKIFLQRFTASHHNH